METHSNNLPGHSMDRGDWRARVHGVTKSQTEHFHRFNPNYFILVIQLVTSSSGGTQNITDTSLKLISYESTNEFLA